MCHTHYLVYPFLQCAEGVVLPFYTEEPCELPIEAGHVLAVADYWLGVWTYTSRLRAVAATVMYQQCGGDNKIPVV